MSANAADLAAGREPKNPTRHQQEAEKRIAALRAKVEGLVAIDQAGDRLAEKIDAERDEWLETARERLAAEHGEYLQAVKAARASAQRLAASRGVARWLDGWDLVRGGGGETSSPRRR